MDDTLQPELSTGDIDFALIFIDPFQATVTFLYVLTLSENLFFWRFQWSIETEHWVKMG